MKVYCLKCKQEREVKGKIVVSKNGRSMFKGVCSSCDGKVAKFVKATASASNKKSVSRRA